MFCYGFILFIRAAALDERLEWELGGGSSWLSEGMEDVLRECGCALKGGGLG